jgi:nucleoside-diphosphate-sugar epimerase
MESPSRVLVTGGAGFVGSHAAADYDEQGAEVVEGHDAIVHTAGQVAVTASLEGPHNVSRARAEPDWEPRVSFEDGTKRFLGWYDGV